MKRVWIIAIIALAVALRLAQFDLWNVHHADEWMQYLEQAHRLVTGAGIVPWEYRLGIRNWLMPLLLVPPMALGEAIRPGGMLGTVLAKADYAVLCLAVLLPAAWRLGAAEGRRQAVLALLVAATWFQSVQFGDQVLGEALAAPLMIWAGALLVRDGRGPRGLAWAGALLAAACLLRFQWAGFAGVLVATTLRLDGRAWLHFLLGALPVLVLGGVIDAVSGQVPYLWVWRNLALNLGAGRSLEFGTAGPFAYLRMLLGNLWLALPILVLMLWQCPRRYWPLLAAALVNILLHSLIGHKEYRFIWVSVLALVLVAAIGSVGLVDRLLANRPWRDAALAAFWLGLSWLTFMQTGGNATFRGGGQVTAAAYDASLDPKVCGIVLPFDVYTQVVPATLGRTVPLYRGRRGPPGAALTAGAARAANALVADGKPAGSDGYSEITCHSNNGFQACFYLRPGTCDAASGVEDSLQKVLESEQL